MKLRRHLLRLFKTNANIKKEDVIQDIVRNDDVLFSWTAVTSDLDDEDLVKELLQHFVELWVTMGGFFAAGTWMEYYKQHIESTTKGACGLRKGLKRKNAKGNCFRRLTIIMYTVINNYDFYNYTHVYLNY